MPSRTRAVRAADEWDGRARRWRGRGPGSRRGFEALRRGALALILGVCAPAGCGDPLPSPPDEAGDVEDDVDPAREVPFEAVEVPSPFPGALFVPDAPGPHPGMVVLHGSGGGTSPFSRETAAHLAELGYAALALCWFDCRHFEGYRRYPPDALVRVPLEYTQQALAWLKASEHVGGRRTGVYGASRGAEHALLLAAFAEGTGHGVRPDIVVALAATDVVIPGLPAGFDPDDHDPNVALPDAWTWHGVNLPYGNPIGVEFYSGPIYFDYGIEDEVWPEVVQPWNIVQRALGAGRSVRWYGFQDGWDPDFIAADLRSPVSAYDLYPAGRWRRTPTLVGVGFFDQGHTPRGVAADVQYDAMRAFVELHLPR